MSGREVLKQRVRQLKKSNTDGDVVVYIVSRNQRVHDNHALIAAQQHALAKELPLQVVFCLYPRVEGRAREHFDFMLKGLEEFEQELSQRNIPFILLIGEPKEQLTSYLSSINADAVYADFHVLRGPRSLNEYLAEGQNAAFYEVDSHNIIPVWVTSEKREFAAHTIRRKIHNNIEHFLSEPLAVEAHPHNRNVTATSLEDSREKIADMLKSQPSNNVEHTYASGEAAALNQLQRFIKNGLKSYAQKRNNPEEDALSGLSPYLHFGQINSLRVVLEFRKILSERGVDLHIIESFKMPQADTGDDSIRSSIDALVEELVVRRELSDNFCYYEKDYDSVNGADEWARVTIEQHDADERDYIYSYEELEHAKTHDSAWNAAQQQMKHTGKMHGYMRMYWAKKVKEWTPDAATAVNYLVQLNDFYSIDGADPNGYVGILWSVCGVHDRPWNERAIFGKVRYMNYDGLKRKFDIDAYEQRWLSATLDV